MQEFDKHEIDTSQQLDEYEQIRRSQTPELGATTSAQPSIAPHNNDEDDADDTDFEEGDQGKPSLFDILQDDVEDEDDPHSEQPEQSDAVGSTGQGPGPRACQLLPGQRGHRTSGKASVSTRFKVGVGSTIRINESTFCRNNI